jgi:peptide/nickel transport system permease protein
MKFRLGPSHVIAATMLAAIALFIVLTPLLPGYNPYGQDLAGGLVPIGGRSPDGVFYLLGTDTLGRDMVSRLALAGRVSILIGAGAVVLSLTVGVWLGLVAGYFRGAAESAIMGLADLQLSIPRILLLIAVTAVMGPGEVKLCLLLGITSWVSYGRVARAMALSLRGREFVLAATTQGAPAGWKFGQIVLLEASLSYLGLGVQPPLPSWGLMVSEGQNYLALAPSLAILPSIALFVLIAGFQILSQAFTAENDPIGMAREVAR